MKLKSMEIEGFKSFKSKTFIEFHEKTLISGENYRGKTSIGEAIAYAFCGTSLNGETRNIEDLINTDSESLKIKILFEDDFGNEHELVRLKDKKNQFAYLDQKDEPATQADINNFIINPDAFLTCFNLGYFQKELEDNKKREIIVNYAPMVDYERLFSEMANIDLIKKYDLNIQKNTEYSRINKLKAQAEEGLKNLSLKAQFIKEEIEKNKKEIKDYYIELEEEKEKKLNQKIQDFHKIESKRKEQERLFADYNQKLKEYDAGIEKIKELKVKYIELESLKLKEDITETKEYKEYQSFLEKIKFDEKINNLIDKEKSLCKICGSKIKDITKFDSNKNTKDLELKENEKFNKWKNEYKEKLKEKNDIANKIQYIYEKVKNKPEEPYIEEIKEDSIDLEILKEEFNKVQEKNNKARLFELEKEKNKAKIKEQELEIKKISEMEKILKIQIDEYSSISKALSPGTGIYRKAVENKANFIKEQFNECSIVLEKMQKNGEIKECFEIFYRGRPYRRLSYSEQIFCNLEIANYIKTNERKSLPVFIDNSESITAFPDVSLIKSDQLIISRVVPGKKIIEITKIK